jgi:threonine/homoserine/homoserine lactone efflux protein
MTEARRLIRKPENPPMTLEFLLTSLIVVASPGTGAIYTIAAGLSRGIKASILAAFACTLGTLPHMAAALTGLAALLHASAVAFEIVKYAGVAYLVWMAWQMLRDTGTLRFDGVATPKTAVHVLRDGIVLNLLNPKLSIFFVAFLPQFISSGDETPLLTMTGLSLVFVAMTFVVFALYGVFAGAMRDQVASRPHVLAWLRRSFAAAFGGLALKLAFTER